MRIHFTNLGCKLNQAEMEALARRAHADGHRIVTDLRAADLHVVNTCTVTHVAARSSRKAARRAGRTVRGVRTVLTGCYVDGSPEEAARLAGVDLVVPNQDKERLLEAVYERFPEWRPSHSNKAADEVPVPYVPLAFGNSRALVKIEDGCNMSCAFCIIPSTRGRQRSRDADTLVAEVDALARGGFQEVVLTGVQISSYRSGEVRLASLVERLLGETPIDRLRLTSIAPWDFDPALLDLLASGRICRHFHLSLQSGSNGVLERMRRPYDTDSFARLMRRIARRSPGTAITTDVIVGFPGESEGEFAEGLEFVRSAGFARVHAFPYSRRPGTTAASMAGQVATPILRRRMDEMLAVAQQCDRAFRASQVGATVPVLWERERDGRWQGTSDNYLRVRASRGGDLRRALTATEILGLESGAVRGRPVAAHYRGVA